MSKQREALQLALNALEKHGNSYLNHEDEYSAAKDAIREALAEPEPARKPLTDEEINSLELPPSGCNFRDIVRVIERAHKIGESR